MEPSYAMDIAVTTAEKPAERCAIVPVCSDRLERLPAFDETLQALCRRDIALTQFTGQWGEVLDISMPVGSQPARVTLLGAGASAGLSTTGALTRLGGQIAIQLARLGASRASILLDDTVVAGLGGADALEALILGILLKSEPAYSLKSWSASKSHTIEHIQIVGATSAEGALDSARSRAIAKANAVSTTRRLVNAPPNVMTPSQLIAESAKLQKLGLEVVTFTGDAALSPMFPGLVAVGRGSSEESGVAIIAWRGSPDPEARFAALSAKGVTFDSGGLTPKTEAGQRLMKIDMAGAASAIGVMQAIAQLKLPINVVAAIGAVENLSGPGAYRSGDVITMADGTTVEVTFPDAEGRIVMGDLNVYLAQQFDPEVLVNISTLTYAAGSAVGDGCTALFANDDALSAELIDAGSCVGEPLWRLPHGERYARLLSSEIADFKNMVAPGTWGLAGSASAAAEFLRHFAGDRCWASLDMLGPVWQSAPYELGPAGATGSPTLTMVHWLAGRATALDSKPT